MLTSTLNILIADDDIYCQMGVKSTLDKFGIVSLAKSSEESIELIKKNKFDLAVIDMQMESSDSGIKVLEITKKLEIPTIILSSIDDDKLTENAYDLGCLHFLNKLHFKSHLEHYVTNFINRNKSNHFQEILSSHYITMDPEIISKLRMLYDMNLNDKCIFITGETGVGKSQIGKIIHNMSSRKNKNFVHINCSELTESLIESELFGHIKGSFTGALSDKKGKLAEADGGTLFLDEIATMPMKMQQKLLKVLDEKIFYPVGSNKPVKSNFTLICATCEDLLDMISKNEFRKDLFFRISGINFEIKPLRKRTDDITLLARHFLKGIPRKVILKKEVINYMLTYSWPGNIRELKKMIDYFSSINKGIITLSEIPTNLFEDEISSESLISKDQLEFIKSNGFRKLIELLEKEAVENSMQRHQGKITSAVKELKISNSAFYRILQKTHLGM